MEIVGYGGVVWCDLRALWLDHVSGCDCILLVLGGACDEGAGQGRSALWCDVVVGALVGTFRTYCDDAAADQAAVGEVEQEVVILWWLMLIW